MSNNVKLSERERVYLLANLYADKVPAYGLVNNAALTASIVGIERLDRRFQADKISPEVRRKVRDLDDQQYIEIAQAIINHERLGLDVLKAMIAGNRIKIVRETEEQRGVVRIARETGMLH